MKARTAAVWVVGALSLAGCSLLYPDSDFTGGTAPSAQGGSAGTAGDASADADASQETTVEASVDCRLTAGACAAGTYCGPEGDCLTCDEDSDGYPGKEPLCASYKPELARDCNDDNQAVHPGAPPVCGDSIDNGCAFDALSEVRDALGFKEIGHLEEKVFAGQGELRRPSIVATRDDTSGKSFVLVSYSQLPQAEAWIRVLDAKSLDEQSFANLNAQQPSGGNGVNLVALKRGDETADIAVAMVGSLTGAIPFVRTGVFKPSATDPIDALQWTEPAGSPMMKPSSLALPAPPADQLAVTPGLSGVAHALVLHKTSPSASMVVRFPADGAWVFPNSSSQRPYYGFRTTQSDAALIWDDQPAGSVWFWGTTDSSVLFHQAPGKVLTAAMERVAFAGNAKFVLGVLENRELTDVLVTRTASCAQGTCQAQNVILENPLENRALGMSLATLPPAPSTSDSLVAVMTAEQASSEQRLVLRLFRPDASVLAPAATVYTHDTSGVAPRITEMAVHALSSPAEEAQYIYYALTRTTQGQDPSKTELVVGGLRGCKKL